MLVLLIIFMVAAPLATVDIKVDLPAATAEPQPKPDKPLYLTIKADHSLALGNEAVTLPDLPNALRASSEGDAQQRIFLRADKSVDYDTLIQTMNRLREAGYLKVALVALEGGAAERAAAEGAGS
ncbi:MAG: TonB system transport protein ExbD [Parahaliea sp.]